MICEIVAVFMMLVAGITLFLSLDNSKVNKFSKCPTNTSHFLFDARYCCN